MRCDICEIRQALEHVLTTSIDPPRMIGLCDPCLEALLYTRWEVESKVLSDWPSTTTWGGMPVNALRHDQMMTEAWR